MKKIIGIYKITSPSGKIYIGQSRNIKRRFNSYKNIKCKHQVILYRSLLKHGYDKHTFEIIEECEVDMLNERERYWQEYYDVLGDKGLNCLLTSTNSKQKIYTESVRIKISQSNKGKVITKEHRDKLRIAFTGDKNHFYGKKHTDEARLKISLSRKGKKITGEALNNIRKSKKKGADNPLFGIPRTEDVKIKISLKNKGKKLTEEHKAKIVRFGKDNGNYGKGLPGVLNGMYGKKHSDETKRKISLANKGHKHSADLKDNMSKMNTGGGNPRARIVLNMETGIYYDCGKDAAFSIGINYSTVKCWLNGSNKNKSNLIYV